jgi:serine-type D-Ala-D-Ala carboxypeptidase (penicillin-binding protein 5/6)
MSASEGAPETWLTSTAPAFTAARATAGLLVSMGSLMAVRYALSEPSLDLAASVPTVVVGEEPPPRFDPAFDHLALEAQAAYVYDITNGEVLFALREDEQMPLASVTKVMTALVAHEYLPEHTVITVSHGAIALRDQGDSGLWLYDQWSLRPLLDLMLMRSSNEAAHSIAQASTPFINAAMPDEPAPARTFVGLMNERAREIGMENSYFLNPTGLDVTDEVNGGYGTARDVAVLFSYDTERSPDLLTATTYQTRVFTSLIGNWIEARNTNSEVSAMPGIRASKTGYTGIAGGNLAIMFDADDGRSIAVVVLGSTREGRIEDVRSLMRASIAAIAAEQERE